MCLTGDVSSVLHFSNDRERLLTLNRSGEDTCLQFITLQEKWSEPILSEIEVSDFVLHSVAGLPAAARELLFEILSESGSPFIHRAQQIIATRATDNGWRLTFSLHPEKLIGIASQIAFANRVELLGVEIIDPKEDA